jgi:hypothetical protein
VAARRLVSCESSSPARPQTAPPPPPPDCAARSWVLLHVVQQCADIRSGLSGYWIFKIVEGAHAGKEVVAYYGEGRRTHTFDNWSIAKTVSMGRITFDRSQPMDNQCTQLGGTATYDGAVDELVGFRDERSARDAFAKRCAK